MSKKRPGDAVVIFAVGFDKGGLPGDGAARRATRAGIVVKGDADGAGGQVLDIIPADGQIRSAAAGPLRAIHRIDNAGLEIGLARGAWQADAGHTRYPLRTGASPGTAPDR